MRFPRLIGATLAVAMLWHTFAGAAAPPSEYQVKAVFLFNFGQFVDWPAPQDTAANAPFNICILGEDPFGTIIDDVVRGESLHARPLVVRRMRAADEAGACHILFIGRNEEPRLRAALDAVRGRSVLTVTDIDGAEQQGAIIVLFNEKNRVRMRINLAAAKASSLVISSKLLRPAVVVGQDGGG